MSEYPCGGAQREQQLMLYVGGELLPRERLQIEAHLRNCPLCREQQHFLRSTMQSVAAEVRGAALPRWEAPGITVSSSALSGRFHGKPLDSMRLVTLAAISAAAAILTSYMAATYGDRLIRSYSVPLSHVSTVVSPPCVTPTTAAAKSCHNCASPSPNLSSP
jgi:anti-sigma factor RsiW